APFRSEIPADRLQRRDERRPHPGVRRPEQDLAWCLCRTGAANLLETSKELRLSETPRVEVLQLRRVRPLRDPGLLENPRRLPFGVCIVREFDRVLRPRPYREAFPGYYCVQAGANPR